MDGQEHLLRLSDPKEGGPSAECRGRRPTCARDVLVADDLADYEQQKSQGELSQEKVLALGSITESEPQKLCLGQKSVAPDLIPRHVYTDGVLVPRRPCGSQVARSVLL